MSDRDVRLNISATDTASGPLGRVKRSVDTLKDGLASFDASSLSGVERSFSKAAREIAKGTRDITKEIDVMSEAIEASEKNMAAAAGAMQRHASDIATAQKGAADARASADTMKNAVAAETARRKRLEEAQAEDLIRNKKALSDHVVEETRKIAADERKRIQVEIDRQNAIRGSLSSKRDEASVTQRAASKEQVKVLRRRLGYIGRLESLIEDKGLTWHSERRVKDFVGDQRLGEMKASFVPKAAADFRAQIAEIDDRNAKAQNRIDALERVAAEKAKDAAALEKRMAQNRSTLDAEAARHGKLVEMRAKGRQMLADYQSTASVVTDTRAEFGRQKDPVRVASAIDAASGANGEVTRTATANRRLASGAAEATEALKRQNAALAQNGNFLRDARNAVSGLVTLYMILTTVTDQAGKAVDAFRSRQAFDSKLNFVNDGDLQKTAASLDYVRGIAARYGLEIVDLQERYSSFAVSADAVGVSTQKVETVFNGLSAAARVNKLNADQFGRAVNALTQSMSKNKVMSEELKSQLAEALPGAVGLFAKSMGYAEKDMAQFYKDLENGMFDAEAVVKFGAYLEKTFSGAADKAGDSFDAALNRFRNSLTYAREAFANSGLIDGLTDFMTKSREFLDSDEGKEFFAQAGEAAKSFLGIMGHLVTNIDLIGKVLGGLVIAKFAKGLIGPIVTAFKVLNGGGRVAVAVARNIGSLSRVLRVLRVAFVGLTGPIGAVVTALSFALPWILDLFSGGSAKDSVAATKRADEVSNAIGEVSKAAVSAKGDVDALSKSLAEIGKGKIDAAMDAAKVSQGAAAGAIRSVRDDIVTRNEKGYVGRARQAINVANPSLASNRLLDQSLRDFYEGKLALDAKPGASAEAAADTLIKVLDDLRKASVITDEELNALKKEAQAYDLQRDALKKLGQAKDAAAGDKSAAGELLNGMSAEIAEQNAKKIQQVDAALTSLEDKAKDATGIRDIKKSMLENAKAVEAATKKLEENRDALSPSEYASRADRIAKAYKAMGDDIAKSFFNATAAANGFDVTLGEMSSRQLQAMTASTTPESVANAGTSEREAYIREGLIKRGMPAHVADGFIANFKDESGLRPGAVEGAPNVHGTRGYGLYQLTDTKAGDRRSQFEKFATDSGRKFDDMDAQMDFLVHELQTSERGPGEAILRSGSASEAAQLIVSKFLRPAKKHENARVAKYAKLDATPAGSGPASVSSLSVWNPDVASQSDMRKSFSNAQGISTVLSGYGEKARDAVTAAVLKTPGLVSDTSLLLALQEKRIEDAAAIISQTDQALADAFRENSAGTAAEETTRKAADKAKDLAEAAKKANEEIVDNVTKKLINDVRDEREKFAAETKAELDKQVREEKLTPLDAEKLFASRLSVFDAERASRSGDVMSDSARSMDDRLAAAGAMNDRAREELRLRGEIAKATENGKTSLTEAQKQQYVLNGLTAYDAEQRRSAADAADAEVRGARDAAAVAGQRSEIDKIRLRTLQEIAEEERKTGVSLSQSQKDARVNANVDRFKAENPAWRVDEIAQANDTSVLDARASAIRAQMEAANGAGDLTKVETLKGQLAEINAELLRMIDLSISAMSGLSGPEAQKALADLQARRAEIAGTSDTVTRYGQAAQYWGVRAGETLSGGIGAFAKAVAESENPWQALAQTVAGSVGQIMIDIGEMIVKAMIAQAVMKALGIDQSGMPLPGASSSGPGGLLGSIIMGGFSALTGTGQYALPVHHEGGTVGQAGGAQRSLMSALTGGLKGDERLAVLQIGEEVVTGKDARHRDNLGRSLGRIRRYHNGGVVDLSDGDSKVSGFAGLAASAVGAAAKAPETVVNNLFDADDFINRTLGGRQGENMIANVISKNPKRFKTLMGGA